MLMKGTSLPWLQCLVKKATWGEREHSVLNIQLELSMQIEATESKTQENRLSINAIQPLIFSNEALPLQIVVNAAKLLIAAWTSLNLAVTFQISLILDVKPQEYKCSLTTKHSRQ